MRRNKSCPLYPRKRTLEELLSEPIIMALMDADGVERKEVTATYDPATKRLSWNGSYSGLTGPATAAHIHGPGQFGQSFSHVQYWKNLMPLHSMLLRRYSLSRLCFHRQSRATHWLQEILARADQGRG
jgi:hypothetical protein